MLFRRSIFARSIFARSITLSLLLLFCLVAAAKKKKPPLPADIVHARTAWVVVDPNVGVDVEEPNANQQARADVETALAKWGWLVPVTDPSQADVIIVVRKGNNKPVQPTIAGTPLNEPPPVIGQRTDTGISGSGRMGRPDPRQEDPHPHPEMEVGGQGDVFTVYRGDPSYYRGNPALNSSNPTLDDPLNAPPVWRYTAKNALESPSVPAVDQFRKVMEKSQKILDGN